jgi:tetratricopeptide (TPR) repeat protein
MTATARRARKHIREDQLVTTTMKVSEWAQEHFNQVIIGVVALVAIVAVLVFAANSRVSNARDADRLMGSAMTLMQQGDLNSALSSFDQIAQRYGGDQGTAARFFKAECELRLGNYKDALSDYDTYLGKKADYPTFANAALVGKGLCYEGLQNWDDAAAAMVASMDAMDKSDPRYYESAYRAGEDYTRAGKLDDARKYLDMVVQNGTGDVKNRATVALSQIR